MTDDVRNPDAAAVGDDPAAAADAAQQADATTPGAGGADVPPAAPPAGEPVVETAVPLEDVPPADGGRDPLQEAQQQAAEYLQLAQRKQAEFENFRKRMQLQAAQAQDRGVAKVAKELLAPLDHLSLAIEHAADDAAREPLEGLRKEFLAALGRVGVESFDPTGEPFDPTVHEAMTSQPVEGAQANTVVSVYQRGYKVGETVLRPARVVVAA